MKYTLAQLLPTERDALTACHAHGLHRCKGGFHICAGGIAHSPRAVMSLHRLGLIRFRNGDTTQPGTCTVAGATLLDGGIVRIEQQVPA